MADFPTLASDLSTARKTREAKFKELSLLKEKLKAVLYKLRFNEENGYPLDSALITERDNLITEIGTAEGEYTSALENELSKNAELMEYDHKESVEYLDDHTPVLLFPVRIETAFQIAEGHELWVRIFPDDIAIETHEDQLTNSEITSGQDYWKSVVDDPASKVNAWDVLSRNFGAERSAWITLQTTPTNLSTAPNSSALTFPVLTAKMDSWSRQPVTRVMPDAFIVTGYANNAVVFEAQGAPVTDVLKVGIDPNNDSSFTQQNGDLSADPELDWLINFESAVQAGMGLKIQLTEEQYTSGFDRIVVLGIKATLDNEASRDRLEELFNNHHYTDGLSLLKQGTNTNNTDSSLSGYGRVEFGNQVTHSVEREADLFTVVNDDRLKSDGQRLAEALGIDYKTFQHVFHSNGQDISNAMYMNNVLWQATAGYYLRDMMYPLVTDSKLEEIRTFFTSYVRSRGALPSIRSGRQPYGILPTTSFTRLRWSEEDPNISIFQEIKSVTDTLDTKWTELANRLPHAAAPMQDTERRKALANILAKSPVSVDYYQRIGAGAGYIWNNLAFNRQSSDAATWFNDQQTAADNVIADTGLSFTSTPRILQTNFLQKNTHVNMPLVADKPGTSTLPTFSGSSTNFIKWMRQAPIEKLKTQNFAGVSSDPDEEAPRNMLFRLLRQSLLLEYWEAATKLWGMGEQEKMEGELLNVLSGGQAIPSVPGDTSGFRTYSGTSRWRALDDMYTTNETAAEYIQSGAANGTPAVQNLNRVLTDLSRLENLSTSELSLLTAEVIDQCTFRLDAWRLAFVTERLNAIRFDSEGNRIEGIFLGAYGWVEDVRARQEPTIATPPTINFEGAIEIDEDNQGFIHAPSINHAVTAALLRSGYISRADSTRPNQLAVNLSSERVRMALSFIEGVKNGQELAALLGYQFEKALHERYDHTPGSVELDKYILPFREKWPLRSLTPIDPNTSTEAIKARNVVNGIDLMRDYRSLGNTVLSNVSGFQGIVTQAEKDIIFAELDRLENILDAIGDLAVAEGAFQVAQGHPTRANAVTEAISKGKNIPELEVVRTPRTGTSLTNRITFNLNPENTSSQYEWSPDTQRVKAEPVLSEWLSRVIGDPNGIACTVEDLSDSSVREVLVKDLAIAPIDFVLLAGDELKNDDSELSLRIRKYVRQNESIPASHQLTINYGATISSSYRTFHDMQAVTKHAKRMITGSRYLTTSDYITPGLALGVNNSYDLDELYLRVSPLISDFDYFRQQLQTQLGSFTGTSVQISALRQLLSDISHFGIEQTIYEFIETTAADGQILKTNAESVLAVMDDKWTKVSAITFDDPGITPVLPEDEQAYVDSAMEIVAHLFGKDFKVLPLFYTRIEEATIINPLLSTGGTLLNDHTTNPYVMDEWFQSVAKVRPQVANFEMLSIMASGVDLGTLNMFELKPVQLPYANDGSERWMAVKMNSTDAIKPNRVSIAVCAPDEFSPDDRATGLLIDEWVEIIPNAEETTGLAVHYNQPNSKAPQCLILGVTPEIKGYWSWPELMDMLNETLDAAKKRAVDYENLSNTGFAHLLPGVMFPFTPTGAAIGLINDEVIGE